MKKIPKPFEWIKSEEFFWPNDDTKLKLVNDWVSDVDTAVKFCDGRKTAVQAGGACGLWPMKLAEHFDEVITFEPCEENYNCLIANCADYENIKATRGGLGAYSGMAALKRDDFEDGNAGAWYSAPGNDFEVFTIDGLDLESCDMIMLDVEGDEFQTLRGAKWTIEKFKPVVVIEQKNLPHMKEPAENAADYLIQTRGYKEVAKVHNDLILCWGGE